MNAPRPLIGSLTRTVSRPVSTQWTARKDRLPSVQTRLVPYTRRYDVCWIDDDGFLNDFTRVAPAMPIFESGFNALAHGALVSTPRGHVAVEDLVPGMMVDTATGEAARLRWVGAMTLVPNAPERGDVPDRLYRIVTDSFGFARPSLDVTLGPGARLLDRSPEVCQRLGTEAALAPVTSLADGESVLEIAPLSPVRLLPPLLRRAPRHLGQRARGGELPSRPGRHLQPVGGDARAVPRPLPAQEGPARLRPDALAAAT
jgi:hypothetical protein